MTPGTLLLTSMSLTFFDHKNLAFMSIHDANSACINTATIVIEAHFGCSRSHFL